MRKLFLFLIASIVLFGACGNKASKEEKLQREAIREYVEGFLLRYPKALCHPGYTLRDLRFRRLVDLVKITVQSALGQYRRVRSLSVLFQETQSHLTVLANWIIRLLG